ncbi:hypothetical protein YC2023_052114 [Brassica napus]
MAMKSTTKSQLATGKSPAAMYFNDISPGPSKSQLRFRLIHFWEAENIAKAGAFIGLELLLIDEQVSSNPQLSFHYVVGHLRLVNGQFLTDRPVLDESEIISMRHILVHLQTKDGPVMKLYLWNQAAKDFYKKFTSNEDTPTVLLVTTVNPKTVAVFGDGVLRRAVQALSRAIYLPPHLSRCNMGAVRLQQWLREPATLKLLTVHDRRNTRAYKTMRSRDQQEQTSHVAASSFVALPFCRKYRCQVSSPNGCSIRGISYQTIVVNIINSHRSRANNYK